MNWFDEQLRDRERSDRQDFADALQSLAGAVMGTRLRAALDCGELVDSAIGEILKYYHCKPKGEAAVSADAPPEEQIAARTRPFGIRSRRVELERGWYRHAVGAMLGTLKEDGSAVALIPGALSGYRFCDLRTGEWTRLNRKTEQLIDREAVCFYQPLPQKALKIPDLLRFMVEQLSISDIVLYVCLLAGSAVLGLLSPKFTQWLFRDVLASGSLSVLLALAGFMICFSISRLCFASLQAMFSARISTKQSLAVQAAVMSRIMSLPATFFRQFSAGELSQRASYVQSLCTTIFTSIGMTGLTSLFSLIYIGQIFAFAPSLVVPALTITAATALLSLLLTFAQMKITRERMDISAKTSGMTYSTITGIQKIKLAGAEKRMFSRWARQYAGEAALQYHTPLPLRLGSVISLALSLGGTLLIYAVAIRSRITAADYYAFSTAYGMVSSAFFSLTSIAVTVANIRPALEMAKPILETEPEQQEGREPVSALRGGIELSHVTFHYDDAMANVIDDLSLKIAPGEYVAIVGPTGCGKSTLLRLLLGFETPQKGSILYDRRELQRINLESLRRQIGVVLQDGKLFAGDIFSNIVISAPQLPLQAAWEAAEIASIADDIRAMPMGMHTVIAEGQGGISGGQKQRLMIARAVAPKPKILMFDEATSALDNVTQKKVVQALDALHCTRIMIAHRLSTIQHADRILYLERGRVLEEGTYDELIARNGAFAALVARQRIDDTAEE